MHPNRGRGRDTEARRRGFEGMFYALSISGLAVCAVFSETTVINGNKCNDIINVHDYHSGIVVSR